MKVPKDFAGKVAELSSSTPREAIANLLSALMPRVEAQVRAPTPVGDLDDIMRKAGQMQRERNQQRADLIERLAQPDPLAKLQRGRTPKKRKPLPMGLLAYARPNPKKRGSQSAARYDQYVLGKTAAWHVRHTEITATDIHWDVDHNFIRFE